MRVVATPAGLGGLQMGGPVPEATQLSGWGAVWFHGVEAAQGRRQAHLVQA